MEHNSKRPAAVARGEPDENDRLDGAIFSSVSPPTAHCQLAKLRHCLSEMRRLTVILELTLEEIEIAGGGQASLRFTYYDDMDAMIRATKAITTALLDFEDQMHEMAPTYRTDN